MSETIDSLIRNLAGVSRQRGAVVRSVVFTTATIARLMVQLPPKLVVASLDKMLHDNYLCLVESNKQQIKEVRSKIQAENSETKATSKRVWIRPIHSASVAFS